MKCTPCSKQARGLRSAYAKRFRVFLFTDRKNNTFRTEAQPTLRVPKKLLEIAVEIEPMQIERVYLAGDDSIFGDAPSRSPADRAIARNLCASLAPIRDTMCRMFWAPDEIAGEGQTRLKQLKIEYAGFLTYRPEELLSTAGISNEAPEVDELVELPSSFSVPDMTGGEEAPCPSRTSNLVGGPGQSPSRKG